MPKLQTPAYMRRYLVSFPGGSRLSFFKQLKQAIPRKLRNGGVESVDQMIFVRKKKKMRKFNVRIILTAFLQKIITQLQSLAIL